MTFAVLAAPLLVLASGGARAREMVTGEVPPVVAPAPVSAPQAASNVIFAEVLGNGLLYSINYERIIERWNIGLRAGASYFTYAVSSYGKSRNLKLASFPMIGSYYVGSPTHKLQLGLGATILYTGASSDSTGTTFESERSGGAVAATAVVGYRYLPPDRGFSFGVGFTPLLRSSSFLPWGGAHAGYIF
jgi:hypothetical protein